jgi:signal peptidase I
MARRPKRSSRKRASIPAYKRRRESRWGFGRALLVVIVLAWAIRSLVAAPFSIPSGSMLPTLYIGDYLVVAKWPYGYSKYSFPLQIPPIGGRLLGHLPNRGDVVVFRHPGESADLIKRVIAVPGDTVAVEDGVVILNGKPLPRAEQRHYPLPISANTPCKTVPPAPPAVVTVEDRPYCLLTAYRETLPGGPSYTIIDQVPDSPADNFPAARVPAGHIFLMGDNRDDSLDSRFSSAEGGIGMVPVENIIGRAAVTFWSTDGTAS